MSTLLHRMAEFEIVEIGPAELANYATIPSRILVTERLECESFSADGASRLRSVPVRESYIKRYDDQAESDPRRWPALFTLVRWGFFVARRGDEVLGGAAVAPGSDVSVGDALLAASAVLWDIRVDEGSRRDGVGAALFRAVERWSVARGFSRLIIETQDINVGACRFYQSMGCTLTGWQPNGYADLRSEARLVWQRALINDQRWPRASCARADPPTGE